MKRFWDKVNIKGPTECWEWQAKHKVTGYGRFHLRGKDEMAHRISWVLNNGPIPEGMDVLHICDNPGCVNPVHLFIGTHTDNMRDALKKGRLLQGEDCIHSKLTKKGVLEIRDSGETTATLSEKHGVTIRSINQIKNRETWKHI